MKKVFVVEVLLGINLNFCRNYFHQHIPETYPELLQTSKIEKLIIVVNPLSASVALM